MTPRVAGQTHLYPQEEGVGLPDFQPEMVHLLLR